MKRKIIIWDKIVTNYVYYTVFASKIYKYINSKTQKHSLVY